MQKDCDVLGGYGFDWSKLGFSLAVSAELRWRRMKGLEDICEAVDKWKRQKVIFAKQKRKLTDTPMVFVRGEVLMEGPVTATVTGAGVPVRG